MAEHTMAEAAMVGGPGRPKGSHGGRRVDFAKAMRLVVNERDDSGEPILISRLREVRDSDPKAFLRMACKVLVPGTA